ncbi:MAG TPA: transposase [Acidimicrobiales bacterium]|nr:transposase [Acidimicrobiales bacterium]
MNQTRHLGFTAPDQLRQRLSGVSRQSLAKRAASLRPQSGQGPVVFATTTALRALGRRVLALDHEAEELDTLLDELVAKTAPELLAVYGVGPGTAASLRVAAGDNLDRLRSEAAWAHPCGVAPIEMSSEKTKHYRLNRSGDRQADAALWRIVITRMYSEPRIRAYVARRSEEGLTKSEIIRVLKALRRSGGLQLPAAAIAFEQIWRWPGPIIG